MAICIKQCLSNNLRAQLMENLNNTHAELKKACSEFKVSSKLCPNLYSRKWLNPNRNLFSLIPT